MALCWILSFLRFVATIGIASVMITLSLAEFGEKWRWLVTVSTVLGAAVDILITVPLCYDLVKKRQSSVHRLVRLQVYSPPLVCRYYPPKALGLC